MLRLSFKPGDVKRRSRDKNRPSVFQIYLHTDEASVQSSSFQNSYDYNEFRQLSSPCYRSRPPINQDTQFSYRTEDLLYLLASAVPLPWAPLIASVQGTIGRTSDLFWIVESPQSVRQKICEARKSFPLRRGRGEAMIESGIHYKIFPDRIRDGPQIPDCISVDEGLREMPEFACDGQPSQWV